MALKVTVTVNRDSMNEAERAEVTRLLAIAKERFSEGRNQGYVTSGGGIHAMVEWTTEVAK